MMMAAYAAAIAARNRAASDPYYSLRSLGLHCDGTNGSTSFLDNSPTPNTVTANGTAEVSTAAPKYGSGALLVDASTNCCLSIPTSSAFDFGSGDLTISMWVNRVGTSGAAYGRLFWSNNGDTFTGIGLATNAAGNDDQLALVLSLDGATWALLATNVGTLAAGYNHVEVSRSGTTWRVFVSGVQTYTTTVSGSLYYNSSNSVVIGGQTSGMNRNFNGYIDDVLVIKGVAVHTANFTPPTAAFPNS